MLALGIVFHVRAASAQILPGFDDPRWSASNGVWEIGVPSSGPGSCHGGTQCAATVLAGNYDPNTDSRLESPSVDLPAIGAGEELQLRFWQWFSYSFSDNGTVQIAVFDPATQTFGSWQNVASAVGLYSSVVWSRRIVDLSTFAGKRVRIGFFHNAADDGNVSGPDNGLGWYIDDLTIEVVTPAFTGDFECGWGDWSASNGVWEIGVPSSGPGSCHGGTQCAATVLGGNYDPNTDSRLETPPIDLPVIGAAEELQLRFWQWFSYSFSDNGTVQIAVFDPATQTFGDWQNIATPVGGFGSVTWTSRSVDVGTFAGKRVRFGFFHNAADDGNVSGPDVSSGWYIDDICLVGPGPNVQCFPCTGPTATPHPLTPSPTPSTSPIVTATATPAVTATSGATPTNPITPTALSPSTTATATPNPSQTPSAMPTCPPAAECVVGTVGKGGTVTTDTENDDTTPDDPVETWVMPPIGCTIGIIEAPLPPGRTTTNGFQFLGQEIDINAACDDSPEVNPGAPLRIVIDVNLSQLGTQQRQKPLTLDLFRNGCPVLPCTGDVDVAYPSPCWVDKQLVQDGDAVRFTVLTAKASTWNTGNALDAFLCHQAKPSASAPKFTATDVSLAIDGAVRVFAVPAVGALCNPADLQGGGILDDEAHLQSFKTKLAKVCASQRTLCRTAKDCNSGEACVNQDPLTTAAPEVVRDGFGVLVLDAQAPQGLRVPSAKAEGAMPAPLDPQAHTVPPFACGKVKVRKGVCVRDTTRACKTDGDCGDAGPCSATPARRVVSVKDQFTVDPVVFVLGQPTVLCSPVAFGGVTEVNDLSHLLCYRAKRARKECANTLTANSAIVCRKEEDCGGISRNTQFCASQSPADTVVVGVQALLGSPIELERDATKEVELCVPATVD